MSLTIKNEFVEQKQCSLSLYFIRGLYLYQVLLVKTTEVMMLCVRRTVQIAQC